MATLRAHCPRCDGERVCDIHGSFEQPWEHSDGRNSSNGQQDHSLVQCRGCEQVFYHLASWDSEDLDYDYDEKGETVMTANITKVTYPTPQPKDIRPDWAWDLAKVDHQLATIVAEMYRAYEGGLLILASVGLRTALDRAMEYLKINPGLALEEKLKTLLREGFVGETEAAVLGVVVDAGNAAAHRGWAPDQREFKPLLTALEQFLHRTIITGKGPLEIKAKIPPRQPRPKRAQT